MVCMFSHWTGAFPCRYVTTSSVTEVPWIRLSLPGELLFNFIMIEEPISLARCFKKSVLFGQFYNTFTALTTLNPLVWSNTLTALLRLNWQNL